jgi:hypothetical protein
MPEPGLLIRIGAGICDKNNEQQFKAKDIKKFLIKPWQQENWLRWRERSWMNQKARLLIKLSHSCVLGGLEILSIPTKCYILRTVQILPFQIIFAVHIAPSL